MFEDGIEKGVVISELKVTRSEAHENHNKKNGKMLKAKKHHAESYEWGTDEYRKHTQKVTPGQDITDYQNFKVNSMKEALAKVWGLDEEVELDEATGKEIAAKMMKDKTMKAFAPKVAKMKSVTADDLEKMLPDYVAGGDIVKLFAGYMSSSYNEASARRDAMRAMRSAGEFKDKDDDDMTATDADVKAASKNILMQMRKASNLGGKFEVEFLDKKKVKVKPEIANAFIKKYEDMRKPADKEKFQNQAMKSYKDMLKALKDHGAIEKKDFMKGMMKAGYNEETILDRITRKLKENKNG